MVLVTHVAVEVFPKSKIFAKRAISAAGNVAKDPIKLEVFLVTALLEIGELASIVVRYQESGQIQLHGLVG